MTRNIIIQYLVWHFVERPAFLLQAWMNFLRFNLNYWSVPQLLKTFFSHWRRYSSSYGRGFDLGRYLSAFTFNVISRILGAVMRTAFIFVGLFIELFIMVAGLFVLAFWLLLPFLPIFLFLFGLKIIF